MQLGETILQGFAFSADPCFGGVRANFFVKASRG
jgi:hypothetical protein